MHAETIGATRRLLSGGDLAVCPDRGLPYLPVPTPTPSKGISVFFGLMVTLGRRHHMNHASERPGAHPFPRAEAGDLVQIGEVEGMVSELTALSTSQAGDAPGSRGHPTQCAGGGRQGGQPDAAGGGEGVALLTRVTIGYDAPGVRCTPCRELAARRCTLLNQDEPPLVRQLNLQDWYVEYELQVRDEGDLLPAVVKTELHGHIQDVFNEFGGRSCPPTSSPSRSRRCWWPGNTGISRPRSLLGGSRRQ